VPSIFLAIKPLKIYNSSNVMNINYKAFNIRAVLSAARGGKIDYKKTRVSHYMYLTIDDN